MKLERLFFNPQVKVLLDGVQQRRSSASSSVSRWPDPIEVPENTEEAPRFLVVDCIAAQHWTAVIAYRDDQVRPE